MLLCTCVITSVFISAGWLLSGMSIKLLEYDCRIKASMSRTPDKEHMNQTHCSMIQTIFIHNVNDPVLCKTDPVHTKLDTMNVPDKHGQIQTDSVMSQMISQVMSQVMQNDLTDHLHETCSTSEPP